MRTGLMYAVGTNFTVASITDGVFQMSASADTPFILHMFKLTTDETVNVNGSYRLQTRSSASTGGTAQTEVPLHSRNTVAADTVVETNLTASGGIEVDRHVSFRLNKIHEYLWLPPPKDRINVAAGEFLLLGAVSSSATGPHALELVWEEI